MKHGFSVAVLRSLIVGVLSLPLASNLLFGSVVSAHASGATLPTSASTNPLPGPIVISEINWAGSPVSALDQWIELYNTTDNAIDFAAKSYSLYSATTDIADLKNGVIPAHGFFLISRQDQNHTSLQINPDYVAPNFVLPTTAPMLSVQDSNGTVTDQVGDGVNSYPAGSDATGTDHVIKSMYRLDVSQAGTLSTDWASSHTVGGGFKVNTDPLSVDNKGQLMQQWGTPQDAASSQAIDILHPNPELAQASNVNYQANPTAGNNPTISGQLMAQPGEIALSMVSLDFQRVDTVGTIQLTTSVDGQGNFSITPTHDQLPVGLYHVFLSGKDTQSGSQLPVMTVMSSDMSSPQGVYAAGSATVPVVSIQAPVLNPYPVNVSTPTVTLTGSVQSGIAVVISINGQNIAQQNLEGTNSFSLPVTLIPNTTNTIEVRARDAAGNTGPAAIATITHSNVAPMLQMNAVSITQGVNGQEDMLMGKAGAADLASTVYVYAAADLSDAHPYTTSVMSDGSFGPIPVGIHLHSVLYVVAVDAAGNRSHSLMVTNAISFANASTQVQNVAFSSLTQNGLTVQWNPVPGAVNYELQYKLNNGTYSSPIDVCMSMGNCPTQKTLVNLQSNTDYFVSITPVDAFGNKGMPVAMPFHTLSNQVQTTSPVASSTATTPTVLTPVPAPVSPVTPPPTSATLPAPTPIAKQQTTSPSSNITPTPTVAPSPTEVGSVQSAETQSTNRNLTPWIILISLIALAVIATLAYFYWFGRDEELNGGGTTTGKKESTSQTNSTESTPSQTEVKKEPSKSKTSPDDNTREKRW